MRSGSHFLICRLWPPIVTSPSLLPKRPTRRSSSVYSLTSTWRMLGASSCLLVLPGLGSAWKTAAVLGSISKDFFVMSPITASHGKGRCAGTSGWNLLAPSRRSVR